MKKIILLLFLLNSLSALSQSKGKVTGTFFFNYHLDFTKDELQKSAFEIERAFIGYDYTFNDKLSAKVLLDAGKDNVSDFTYYLRAAQLDYNATKWAKISLGMIGLNQFTEQEKSWGYRYVYRTFQDANHFGTTADLGINTELKLYNNLEMNLFVLNGEGFRKVQDNYGKYKIGGNLVYNPIETLTLKLYYSEQDSKKLVGNVIVENPTVKNISLFAGFDNKKFRFGTEYSKMIDGKKFNDAALDHNLSGFTFNTAYVLNDKFEFFARYDFLKSNKIGTSTDNWNALNDGNALLFGTQFIPLKGVKTSLNYRFWNFDYDPKNDKSMLYLNMEYRF